MNYDEAIVFIIRETGWTLEEARNLTVDEFSLLVSELSYQKAVDDYKLARNAAMIACMWAKKGTKVTDFIGQCPEREKEKEKEKEEKGENDLWVQAKEKGIKTPT